MSIVLCFVYCVAVCFVFYFLCFVFLGEEGELFWVVCFLKDCISYTCQTIVNMLNQM